MKIRDLSIQALTQKAIQIKISILEMLHTAKSGHLGGSIGVADIFTALYFHLLHHNPNHPQDKNRDRVILSAGHLAPVLYASLAHAGYFEIAELQSLRKLGSRLQGHPALNNHLPGIETSSGSLGQGLSIAVGIALSAKYKKENYNIVTILGDGELQEGSIWEAAMSATHYNLSNMIAIVDRNRVQIDGNTENVMMLEPLADKWKSFGWDVFECNGNNIEEFISTYKRTQQSTQKPKVIIANTKMSFGIKSIEDDYTWHGKVPNKEQLAQFTKELISKNNISNE
ncbi:MAG: transketolase [Salinivirgaceae bacterium]|nr:transketolase [Salinivirgaceae bacterium]MDD4746363.1 transketolase [Salinivirgaceae bacterium]MDY0280115.1 transketolase [Salinivirgaceae bacterium]